MKPFIFKQIFFICILFITSGDLLSDTLLPGPDSLKNYITTNKYSPFLGQKDIFSSKFRDYKAVMLVDLNGQRILFEKNAYQMREIASLTKMMSILLVAEEIKKGDLSLNDTLRTSTAACKIGGSQIYLREYERMTVDDLLKSMIIKSANDATYLLAETVGGERKVDSFVDMMNRRSKELNMFNTYFYFPHGLPPTYAERKKKNIRGNQSTCYDLVLLAEEMLKYPVIKKYSSTWLDYIRDEKGKKRFMLRNTSRLIKDYPYFDGLKTGYYNRAGFNIVATAKKEEMRLVAVVLGTRSMRGRDKFVNDLVTWGFGLLEKEQQARVKKDSLKATVIMPD